ncbi:MAG: hypothetical protein WCV80_03765 [Candidatus Paceibacterota bacterium]|jgi:hypothetical protein
MAFRHNQKKSLKKTGGTKNVSKNKEKKKREFQIIRESDNHMEAWRAIYPVLQKFAEGLQTHIAVSNPHGYTRPPKTERGKLFIYFWSVPYDIRSEKIRQEVFGIKLNKAQSDAASPTGGGTPIIDSKTGITIAEIHGGTLYVLFDLPHSSSDGFESVTALMHGIMTHYANIVLPSSPFVKEMMQVQKHAEELRMQIEERKKMFTVRDFSPRCDHWKDLSEEITRFLLEDSLYSYPTEIFFGDAIERCGPDGEKFSIVIRQERNCPIIDGEVIENIDSQQIVYIPKGMHIEVWGICDCPDTSDLKIIKTLLTKAIPEAFEPNAEKRALLVEARRKVAFEALKKRWIEKVSDRLQIQKREAEKAAVNHDAKVREYQQATVKHIRQADDCRTRARMLEMEIREGNLAARHEKEFTQIFKIPHVKDMRILDNIIEIFTDNLYIDEDGVRYDIGEFRIVIYTDGSEGGVRFYNLTRRVDGYWEKSHHPHINGEGQACLGTIQEAIPELIAKYEYSIVITLCLQFLQSVSTSDSAGKTINRWPVVVMPEKGIAA